MTDHPAVVRGLTEEDCATISQAFARQGWHKPAAQYEGYLRESIAGKRTVLVAEADGAFAGYVTIVWESDYPPFREARIPEVVDLNVLRKDQRRGIGTALLDAAEQRIAQRSRVAGIGVGLTADYGAAQAMYARRGYVPDGRGIYSHGRRVEPGDMVTIDDWAVLYLIKQLGQPSSQTAEKDRGAS